MKEEFMKMQTEGYFDDMSDAEYQDWLNSQKPVTQEEIQAQHDAWFEAYYNNNPEMFGLTGKQKGRPMNDELKSGVYLITNTETGETYVGCSNDVKRRIWRHFYNRGRSKNKLLSKALKTYGRDAFTSQVLEYCPKEIKFEREDYYMEQYGCEYNTKKRK